METCADGAEKVEKRGRIKILKNKPKKNPLNFWRGKATVPKWFFSQYYYNSVGFRLV